MTILPDFKGVTQYDRQGVTVYEVDTAKAEYQRIPWRKLGRFGRRKFENLLFIKAAHSKKQAKYIYV